MDHTACHIVLCDKRAETNLLIRRAGITVPNDQLEHQITGIRAPYEVKENVRVILAAFQEVYLCNSGMACSSRLRELEGSRHNGIPLVVFLDVDPKSDFGNRLSREMSLLRPGTGVVPDDGLEEYYGVSLLRHLAAEAHQDGIGKLVIPIALIRDGKRLSTQSTAADFPVVDLCDSLKANVQAASSFQLVEPRLLMKCLDAGATDAFNSPLSADRLQQIIVAAYKAHLQHAKEKPQQLDLKRIRKRSWVGIEEERPYAYLRESMVSSLMNSICRPETAALGFDMSTEAFALSPVSKSRVSRAIGTWNFSAHDFSDDELLHSAYLMLYHCLQVPELEKWRLSQHNLKLFLVAVRAAYNSFVLYHNFRHVVDVLQALFFSLLQIGALPAYAGGNQTSSEMHRSSMAQLIEPFDALVLLVSAIGHDVGHPGVNNAFLVTLKAPLAQLYNDKSVLEAFHCAAYSQILRRHWKVVYEDVEFRRLLINTILATDMGIHPEYMANLGNLQEKLHHDGGTEGWTTKLTQSNKDLLLGLLIKCADISNVARPFDISAKWAQILQQEFARQGEMERDIGVISTLFGGPPELGNTTKLANSQIGFMNFFGLPLFEGVADLLPGLRYAVDEICKNNVVWEQKIEQEKTREEMRLERHRYRSEGTTSPRSASPSRAHFSVSPEASHPEGLPASGLSPDGPISSVDTPEQERNALNRVSLLEGGEDFFTPPASPRDPGPKSFTFAPDTRVNIPEIPHRSAGTYPVAKWTPHASTPETSDVSVITNVASHLVERHLSEPQSGSDKSGITQSSASGNQNFSRPYSHQHSAQPSCTATRSSASRAPTFSSTNFPASPTETHATSLGGGSEIDSPALAIESLDRPPTGYSGSGMVGMSSGPSRASRASVSVVSETPAEKAQAKMRPLTSGGPITRSARDRQAKDKEGMNQVKRKSSRWKFDFWRRRKQAEREAQGLVSPSQPPSTNTS